MKRLAIAVLCALGVIWLVENAIPLGGEWTDTLRQGITDPRRLQDGAPEGVSVVPDGRSIGWTPSGLQPVGPSVRVQPPPTDAAAEAPEPAEKQTAEPRHGDADNDGFQPLIPR